jgi:predicted transcriptional regulator
MTNEEFNSWAKSNGLSVEQAAKVLGISRANAFKYANGSQQVSKSVAHAAEYFDLIPDQNKAAIIKKKIA